MPSPHVDDYGTPFTLTIYDYSNTVLDLSNSLTRQIIFIDPDNSKTITTGSFVTDGTDGKITYTAASGLLNAAGDWGIQGKIVFANGSWSTEVQGFKVLANE